jgi:hypothetical protein
MIDTDNPHSLQRIHRILIATAFIILTFHLVVYVVYAINLIQFPFDYDQGEGFELVDTIMFSRGQWPYQNTEMFPYYSSNYPPLFHIIASPLVLLFGPAYWYGRLLSFLSTLVTASAIGYAIYREGGNRWIASLSGLAFLSSNTVYHIGPLFRQHIIMVMFETLGVVILAHATEIPALSQRHQRVAIGLGMILAAGFTKQLAIATALAGGLFLFIRQPRRAVVWGLLTGLIGVGIFVYINIASNGEWWRQSILANVNELKIIQAVALFRQWLRLHGLLIVPAIMLVIYELYFDRLSIYALWFMITVAIDGPASGAWGGGDSYFATSIAALCVLSGIFAARTFAAGWRFPTNYLSKVFISPLRPFAPLFARASLIVIPLLYIGYGHATLHLPTNAPIFSEIARILNIRPNALNGLYDSARTQDGQYATGYANIGHLTTQADIEAGWRIVAMIRASEKPAISEDAGFNIAADRPVITNPTQLLNLDKKTLYNGTELVKQIDQQDFGLIILRAQFYPEVVLKAISRAYQQTEAVTMNGFNYLILRPKS